MSRILLGMRRAFVCLVASVLLTSCHEGSHINQPSPLPIPTTVPYFLTAGASVGLGADAGHATISVKVQNVEGAPMQDVPVTFETDQGTIDPANAITLVDGTARASLTASVTATVLVSTRTLSQRLLVTAQAPPGASPAPPTPPPGPTPPSVAALTVSLAATPGSAGSPTTFDFASNGTIVQEVWTFGDGSPAVTTTTHTTTHVYVSGGSVIAGVTVLDTLGRTAASTLTMTISPATAPPTPPAPSYAVTLVASPTTVIIGNNATLTATAIPQNGAPAAASYAFDCDNDGIADMTVAAPVNFTSCPYPSAGTITAAVRVTGGSAIGGATTAVTVTVPPLVVNVTPDNFTPTVGVTLVTFTATVSSLGPVPSTFRWFWDRENDGTDDLVEAAASSPHTYATMYGTVGPKVLKVTVIDPATGRTASGFVSFTVN